MTGALVATWLASIYRVSKHASSIAQIGAEPRFEAQPGNNVAGKGLPGHTDMDCQSSAVIWYPGHALIVWQ